MPRLRQKIIVEKQEMTETSAKKPSAGLSLHFQLGSAKKQPDQQPYCETTVSSSGVATRPVPKPGTRAATQGANEHFSIYSKRAATMPYFVYKVSPKLQLTYIDTQERYQDARTQVRELRANRAPEEDGEFRLIFANQQGEAEKLLSTPRDERVIGED